MALPPPPPSARSYRRSRSWPLPACWKAIRWSAVKAGAIGYLLKDTQAAELRRAIKAAAAGQVQLSPQALAYLLHQVRLPETPVALTERETEVLRLLAQGLSNKDIARALQVVEDTVKTHVAHILAKLGVQSRTQAVLSAAVLA